MPLNSELSLPEGWEIRPRGLYCIPGDFYLDPDGQVDKAVVSHAHADHYRRGLNEVWCTPATAALATMRYKKGAGTQYIHEFDTPFKIGPVTLRFLPAGHMLGSAQILVSYAGKNLLFSGDFHLTPQSTCAPLQYPEVPIDLLVCESTFGEKSIHADPHTRLKELIEEANGRKLLIGTYVLGKAQRLHGLFQEVIPEMPIFLHQEILKFHRVYQQFGKLDIPLLPYRSQKVKRMATPLAYFVPPRILSSYKGSYDWFKMFASGWDRKSELHYLDHHLEISDHASAEEIKTYIQRIAPKQVAFHHGYPAPLIEACKMLKIQSYTLPL